MDASAAFAESVLNLRYEDIPDEVVVAVKKIILDSVAVSVAGSSAPGAKQVAALVKEWGGREESTVIASEARVPAVNAALANGAMVRALDYNETYEVAGTHPSVSITPASFAIAEKVGKISGKEFIAAVTSAIDVYCRMTASARVTMGSDWLIPQLHGFLAAAAVAGRLLALTRDQMIDAFGLAYAQTSGGRQSTAERAMARGLQGAFSAKGGVLAALMAKSGITGARNSLEGKHGLFMAYHRGNYDRDVLTADLGKRFDSILSISFKPYPGGRQAHQFIDAALGIVEEHQIRPQQVEEVTVFVGEQARALCEPLDVCRNPKTITEAQHSIPYAVAVAIVKRNVVLNDFIGSGFRDPLVLQTAQSITPKFDSHLVRKGIEPGRVEIKTKSGKAYSQEVEFAKGAPERPFSMEAHVAKFRDCALWAARPLPPGSVDNVVNIVGNLERTDDAGQVMRLLAGT